jgi:hypothetical protein
MGFDNVFKAGFYKGLGVEELEGNIRVEITVVVKETGNIETGQIWD